MKTKNLFLLPTLIAVLNLLSVGQALAQTFRVLHSFTAVEDSSAGDGFPVYSNSEGAGPNGLVLSGNTLYGAAGAGGSGGDGTVFAMSTDGTGVTNLHSFAPLDFHGGYVPPTNPDGADPNGLILSGNTLCGAASAGGWWARGTLFAMNTDGTGFMNLLQSGGWDSGFVLSGNTLYWGVSGTVVATNMNGTVFTNSADGASGQGLIVSGNTLYGTAASGGNFGFGFLSAVNTNGTGFTILHSFTATHTNSFGVSTNSDGANPQVGLLLSGNTLYGTTRVGGNSGNGTVFAVNTNGMGFRVLHNFTATHTNSFGVSTNSDGANPSAGLILSGHTLYGTAYYGGISGAGTVFAVNTNGTGFTNLHSFTYTEGAYPAAGLILSGSTLYGTASRGGSSGSGTVFSLSFAPQLTITRSGTNVILSWATNVAGFDYTGYILQSTTNPISSAVWNTNSSAPVVIAGRNTVTNSIPCAQQFYRLVH